MIIAGGIYLESCLFPRWERLFGSGLRAAIAVSQLSPGSELHGYVPDELRPDVEATLSAFGLVPRLWPASEAITYYYLHPFERLGRSSSSLDHPPPLIEADGEVVLRFGFAEGSARTHAKRAVYDPQSPRPESYTHNGSSAKELAIIARPAEILRLAGRVDVPESEQPGPDAVRDAAMELFDAKPQGQRLVLLVKDPLGGLTVFEGDEPHFVARYAGQSFFRIGAGDVLAAAFAFAWGEQRKSVLEAADFAARCLAYAADGPRLPIAPGAAADAQPITVPNQFTVSILADRTLEAQALLLHTMGWIEEFGGRAIPELDREPGTAPFAPDVRLVLVGDAGNPHEVAASYGASAIGAPTVVYWPYGSTQMSEHYFPGAILVHDYAQALYSTVLMVST